MNSTVGDHVQGFLNRPGDGQLGFKFRAEFKHCGMLGRAGSGSD